LIRALEIEVRVLAEEGRPPGWATHPDEASLWIYEIAQRIAKDVLEGTVQVERHFAEPHSFLQVMSVFASPTARHVAVIQDDLRKLSEGLQHDLAVKFGIEKTLPYVRLEADSQFDLRAREGALAVVHPQVEPPSQPVYVVQPQSSEEPDVNQKPQRATFGMALIWMGALLGAAIIGNIFLFSRTNELQAEAAAAGDLRVQNTRLTMDLALAKNARTFEQAQCTASIAQHREMIADLAQKCSPKQPPPKPPPAPMPYPESPDPFASPGR
jgi:hypothetical protein